MIDLGFLLGFASGCICTAALLWWGTRGVQPLKHDVVFSQKLKYEPTRWPPHPLTRHLGAAARGEVADLAVSAGHFISDVRSLRSQIDRAHATLKDSI